MKRKIIPDCDPEHGDVIAMITAGLSDDIELLGITTVAGNSYLENITKNALIILELAGIDIEIHPGQQDFLLKNQVVAHDIHGYSGLEGANLRKPSRASSKEVAVHFMAKMLEENKEAKFPCSCKNGQKKIYRPFEEKMT
ncbi:MAG: nucleoside hydrolase [Thermotogaceae bacterium]|nr:nucleoside hydrolase [Thermotogaceae bacterium]